MNLRRLSNNSWLYRAVLATWIASAIIVMFLLSRIDTVVNVELYKHGLQFSYDWASPYWTYLNLNYIALGVPLALSLFAIAIGFTGRSKKVPENIAEQQPKSQPVASQEQKSKESSKNAAPKEANKSSTAGISCPNCKKTFSRPMVILDSASGKSRLVNVCPYCDHVLGNEENGKSSEIDAQVADVDEKLTH
jgi:uncharacterized Zn-finger protein